MPSLKSDSKVSLRGILPILVPTVPCGISRLDGDRFVVGVERCSSGTIHNWTEPFGASLDGGLIRDCRCGETQARRGWGAPVGAPWDRWAHLVTAARRRR